MRFLLLAALLALAGCDDTPKKSARHERSASRAAAAASHVMQPAKMRIHALAQGDVVTLETPVADEDGVLGWQKCFVWRDATLKTASISCPSREVYVGQ